MHQYKSVVLQQAKESCFKAAGYPTAINEIHHEGKDCKSNATLMDLQACSRQTLKSTHTHTAVLTETVELGVLVPYPEEGREARDQRRPSVL